MSTVSHYKDLHVDLVYSNLPQLLCLPKCELNLSTLLQSAALAQLESKQRRRIIDMSDVFDSGDESGEEFVSLDKDKKQENVIKENTAETETRRKLTPAEKISGDAITALSDMYDTVSYLDSYVCQPNKHKEGSCSVNKEFDWHNGAQVSGLTDQVRNWDEIDWWKHNYLHDIQAHIEVGNVRTVNDKLEQLKSRKQTLDSEQAKMLEEQLSLPVAKEDLRSEQRLKLCQENSEQKR